MEDLCIEHLLLQENTLPLSEEEADRLAHGDLLEQALSAFLLTGQSEPFFITLAQCFGLSHLAPVVEEYMRATRHIQGIKGLFHLDGLANSLRSRGTWEDWMTDRWGDGLFPGIYIGYETWGTEFLLLFSSGRLISIHHDALPEMVAEIEEEAHSREHFLELLITQGSGLTLTQLIQFQTELWKRNIDNAQQLDERAVEEVRTLVCSLQHWNAHELAEALMEGKMEFLSHYCGQ